MDSKRWAVIQDKFDAALALSSLDRDAFVARIEDAFVRDEVSSLLRAHATGAEFLERRFEPSARASESHGTLQAGRCLGAWRIVRFIGRGGMGEVYEAERADAQFEQRAALKVIRHEAAPYLERFNAERQILARLDHPGIARLLDGGIATDGRPYAAMEYVEGESLLTHCDIVRADLQTRLRLFMQVCDAVAYAHRNLIVHRDIKPSNVLVDREGRTRLLDFGIAKLLDAEMLRTSSGSETARLLTPDYAAPEQLVAESVTTATDVYALGLLLFELLVGRRPWDSSEYSLARIVASALDRPAPKASATARKTQDAPIPARLLEGDLDAILSKCLRPEPEQRYATVNALLSDLERSRRGDPIAARSGARLYVLGRMLRRYRWVVAGLGVIIATLGVGIATTAWQAQRAEREAARATAVRDFLISVFKASDPRIAQDKPRGQVTARELLDASVARIDQKFASDPRTQIELHGIATEIYRELDEEQRYEEMQQRHLALAREHYGETHPIVLSALLDQAAWAADSLEHAKAARLLATLDPLIRRAGADRTVLRARCWLIHSQTMFSDSSRKEEQLAALRKAEDLFAELAPSHPARVTVLADIGSVHSNHLEYASARAFYERSIALAETVKDRNDAELATIYGNHGLALLYSGDFAAADEAYGQAEQVIVRTYGKGHLAHWRHAANRARSAHLGGSRERAGALFSELFKNIPSDSPHHQAYAARDMYGTCLAAEGRPQEAIPLLERVEQFYQHTTAFDFDLPRIRLTLGDAYDRAGRVDDARKALKWALDKRVATVPPDSQALMAVRERWGRFLLSRGDVAGAEEQFMEIIEHAQGRKLSHIALAHGGVARVALARGNHIEALSASTTALNLFDQVAGFRDVRMGPYLWLIHSDVLRRSGDREGALAWAKQALDARRRYDHPSAASIAEAEAAFRAASAEAMDGTASRGR
jgi:eukaryotic-like serine/threonine-protein kinase